MQILLAKRSFHYLIAILMGGAALVLLARFIIDDKVSYVTTVVERGAVVELVSVSGFVEAQNAAALSFPVTGIVASVSVREGDTVRQGDPLITLERAALIADRQNALAELRRAEADRAELIAGPRPEARDITATEVTNAEATLARTERTELERVSTARRTLLSSDLAALSINPGEDAPPPIVSGTYRCEREGEYLVSVFRSAAESGFSYRLSGLETGTQSAFTTQSGPLGSCGLRLQFIPGGGYGNSEWVIAVPNTNSPSYIANLNAYDLALKQAENAIRTSEETVALALQRATLENASPRSEALVRANAAVASAAARLAAVDAALGERVLTAPFDGLVTRVGVLPGETVGGTPIVTVLANDAFDMTVRIPEIDITKVRVGHDARVVFDAQSDTPITATITFISPIAVEIDGVAYFEATLVFPEPPEWLRSGLNADVDITVGQAPADALRLPKRFVTISSSGDTVLTPNPRGDKHPPVPTPVEIIFNGNDGYFAIDGLPEGATVVAP
jgi:HlyD family secretion protein